MSTRSRTFSPRVHDHVRQRQRGRGAAHVLLHLEHARSRLDVEAAGVEADALADQRHLRMPASPHVRSISRGAPVGSAADGVNERKILCQQLVADDRR